MSDDPSGVDLNSRIVNQYEKVNVSNIYGRKELASGRPIRAFRRLTAAEIEGKEPAPQAEGETWRTARS